MTRTCATPSCGTRLRSTKGAAEVYCDPCERRVREAARLAGALHGRRDPALKLSARIPAVLAERGPLSARQLAEETGSLVTSVRRIIFDLIGAGVVEKTGAHTETMRYGLTVAAQLDENTTCDGRSAGEYLLDDVRDLGWA